MSDVFRWPRPVQLSYSIKVTAKLFEVFIAGQLRVKTIFCTSLINGSLRDNGRRTIAIGTAKSTYGSKPRRRIMQLAFRGWFKVYNTGFAPFIRYLAFAKLDGSNITRLVKVKLPVVCKVVRRFGNDGMLGSILIEQRSKVRTASNWVACHRRMPIQHRLLQLFLAAFIAFTISVLRCSPPHKLTLWDIA